MGRGGKGRGRGTRSRSRSREAVDREAWSGERHEQGWKATQSAIEGSSVAASVFYCPSPFPRSGSKERSNV